MVGNINNKKKMILPPAQHLHGAETAAVQVLKMILINLMILVILKMKITKASFHRAGIELLLPTKE